MKKQTGCNSVVGGMAWAFGERISAQLVTFLVSVILARLLSPGEYAVAAIVTIFVTIANVFVTSGFGNALIQKLNTDELDFSTIFYFSLGFSIFIYGILFFCAPSIAGFYAMPELTPIVRVMSFRIVIASINSIQHAYVSRQMAFRKFFFSTLVGTICSAAVGISMAYTEYGVWALVAQYLTNVTVNTTVLWFTCGWRPKWIFCFERLKGLYSYGWKVLVSDLVSTLYEQMRGLVLSKAIAPTELSYYNRGEKFPALFINNIETSMHKVLMPYVANAQQDKERVLQLTRQSMRASTFVIWPFLIGLVVVAAPLIETIYTSKWLGSVRYLQIISLTYLLKPVIETHTRTMKALGRSDMLVKMTAIRYLVGTILLIASIVLFKSPMIIVGSWTLTTLLAAAFCININKKLIAYTIRAQLFDVAKTAVSCIFMFFCVYAFSWANVSMFLDLPIKVSIGALSYAVISWIINRTETLYLFRKIMMHIKKH